MRLLSLSEVSIAPRRGLRKPGKKPVESTAVLRRRRVHVANERVVRGRRDQREQAQRGPHPGALRSDEDQPGFPRSRPASKKINIQTNKTCCWLYVVYLHDFRSWGSFAISPPNSAILSERDTLNQKIGEDIDQRTL